MSFMVRRRMMSRRSVIKSAHDSIPVRTQAPDETCTFHLFNSCLDCTDFVTLRIKCLLLALNKRKE